MLKEVFWAHICCGKSLHASADIASRSFLGRSKSSVDCWTVAGIVSLRVGPKGRVEDGGGGRKGAP